MSWSLALCALASVASAGSETSLSVRGYTLSGEVLLYPAADQQLPAGWSIVSEATADSLIFRVQGLSQITREDANFRTLYSQAMPTEGGQILLRDADGNTAAFGDLMASFDESGWQITSNANEFSGRPVFEIPKGSGLVTPRNENELVFTGELALSHEMLTELGLQANQTYVVGSLVLIASPYFDAAQPIVQNAAPAAVVGPDVIVSGVGSTISKDGSSGGITAYSMTTVSCNVGDAQAIWIDCGSGSNCNQHPVIGQQIYRLKTVNGATRFEQIGMSWLKHGFCAADAPSCTNINPNGNPSPTYSPNGSCDWLGLFATDTYDASLNGSQGNLGPRSEVNAWTGVFPYPYMNNGCGSSTVICKRTQVHNTDLDPAVNTGAQYLGEVVYITTDESRAAGNPVTFNNYSSRKLSVGGFSGGGYSLSFSGSTMPMISAMNWWSQNDAGVTLKTIDVPGDGRMLLGYKVTNLGGGQYHYEYALFNMNSDRCAQGISVPLAPGATCNNVAFHDVDYHSGEPYALTDWTPAVGLGNSVSWSSETFAQNQNANALRWSTTYNYRFDSNGRADPGQRDHHAVQAGLADAGRGLGRRRPGLFVRLVRVLHELGLDQRLLGADQLERHAERDRRQRLHDRLRQPRAQQVGPVLLRQHPDRSGVGCRFELDALRRVAGAAHARDGLGRSERLRRRLHARLERVAHDASERSARRLGRGPDLLRSVVVPRSARRQRHQPERRGRIHVVPVIAGD
jgi:hypothetical protein